MRDKYNSLLGKFEEYKKNKSSSFETSLLYHKEVEIFVNQKLKTKHDNYITLNDKIKKIINGDYQMTYTNTFGYLTSASTNLDKVISKIEDKMELVRKVSNSTYNDFNKQFNDIASNIENVLNTVRHNINSYDDLQNNLKKMSANDPDYNGKLYASKQISNSINSGLNNVSTMLPKLSELLIKGLQKN